VTLVSNDRIALESLLVKWNGQPDLVGEFINKYIEYEANHYLFEVQNNSTMENIMKRVKQQIWNWKEFENTILKNSKQVTNKNGITLF